MSKAKPDEGILHELRRAIEADDPEVLESLFKAGVSLDQRVGDGLRTTLLELAIEKNAVNVTRCLINAGAKLDKGPNRPLIHAAAFNRPEILELLLRAGADPNVTGSDPDEGVRGETALMVAVDLPEKIRIVELLLKHGANPNLANSKGETALYHAVGSGNLEAVCRLLDAGAMPSGIVLHGLIYRCTDDSLKIMKLLIAAGADLSALGTRESHFMGWTAQEAAMGANKDKVELIDQLSRRQREDWEEETLRRWKAEAQILQAMIDALTRAEPDISLYSMSKT
jgi:ankyrin repeat protein